jgi:hypothetical protein
MSGLRRKNRNRPRSRNQMITSKNPQTQHAGEEPHQKTKQSDNQVPLTPTAQAQSKPAKTHCEITCKREQNWWDKAKPWVEIFGAAVLTVYTYYTAKMYCANRDAANAATFAAKTSAKELELSERPWVSSQMAIDGPFEFNVNGVNVHIKFQLTNTGHSPALATQISPQMTSAFSEGQSAVELLTHTCSAMTRAVIQGPGFGVALFPNQPLEETISFGMGKEDLQKAIKRTNDITWPSLVVCIGYRSTFTDTVYHTGYILDLSRIDSATGLARVDFKVGENIDKDHLRLRCGVSNCIVAD